MEFINTFGLHKYFDETYFIGRIRELLAQDETNAAAKLIIQKELFQSFDIPSIVEKLAMKG